jgi:hypothetical protein
MTPETLLRIKSTGRSSEWLGDCEVCGKHCATVYKQQEQIAGGWLNHRRGHLGCLQSDQFANCLIEHDHTAR